MTAQRAIASSCWRHFEYRPILVGHTGVAVDVPREALYYFEARSEDEAGVEVSFTCALKKRNGHRLVAEVSDEIWGLLEPMNFCTDVAIPGLAEVNQQICISLMGACYLERRIDEGLNGEAFQHRIEALENLVSSTIDVYRHISRYKKLPHWW